MKVRGRLLLSLPVALIMLVLLAAPAYAGLEVCSDLWGWDWTVCEASHHTSSFGLTGAAVAVGSVMVGLMATAAAQGAATAGQSLAAALQEDADVDEATTPDEQTLSDGRTYRQGAHYPFDDGQVYEFTGEEFTPVRRMSEGEVYVSPDGDRRIWVGNQSWRESDWQQQQGINESYRQAHAEDWAKESTTLNQDLVQHFAQERAAQQEADRLQSVYNKIKAGRSTLSGSDSEHEILSRLQRVIDQTRSTGRIDPDSHDRIRRIVNLGLAQSQQANMAELLRAQTVARRWEVATKAVELVKDAADKSIDVLANVTGPAGQSIRRTYRMVSNVAGGVSEGYATGNYVQSIVEAGGRIADGEIGDYLKTKKAKNLYTVAKKGTQGAYEGGLEAYKRGDSVLGGAALGALEGTVDGVSSVAKDSLSGGKKMAYTVYEKTVKAGYGEFKGGGNLEDVRKAMEAKFKGAALDEAIDYGTGAAFDRLLPASGAVDSETMAKHQWEILKELNLEDHPELLDQILEDWQPEFIGDEAKKELRGIVKDQVRGTVKGEGLFQLRALWS